MRRKKQGFTLMELIIVIIIIGIMATVGFGQYKKMVERGRAVEARTIIGQIRTALATYALEYTNEPCTDNFERLGLGAPKYPDCDDDHWFSYQIVCLPDNDFAVRAARCEAGGRDSIGEGNMYTIEYQESTKEFITYEGAPQQPQQ